MPELPEVETVRRGLAPTVQNRRIARLVVRDARLRWPVPATLPQWLAARVITGTARRGKYLLLQLDGSDGTGAACDQLIVHLGMSGRIFVLPADAPVAKHDHLDIVLAADASGPECVLRYHDPRRFGAVLPWPAADGEHALMQTMGPEPFSEAFNGSYLFTRSRGKQVAVKSFVMDASVVVGAGNIYAAESLFRAGIRPTRPAGKVSKAEYLRLADCIRAVLAEAIEQGGTTLRDFAGANGESGYFQQDLFVYGREGAPCRVCKTPIKGLRLGNRQSCYCPRCQV